MQSVDRTLLKLDYFLVKHEEVGPDYDRPEAADDPRAEKHQIEEKAPGEKGSPETPKGKVRRFNARFFAVDAIHSHGKIAKNNELLDIDWYPIDYIKNNLPLAQVTKLVLNQIEIIINNNNNFNCISDIPIYSRRNGKRVIRFHK